MHVPAFSLVTSGRAWSHFESITGDSCRRMRFLRVVVIRRRGFRTALATGEPR